MNGFLQLLHILAPYFDSMFGDTRSELKPYFCLRTCCIQLADYCMIPAHIDGQCNISFFIMINEQRRSKCVYYTLKYQIPVTGTLDHRYAGRLSWANQHFTYVVDTRLLARSSQLPKAQTRSSSSVAPVPKSQPRPREGDVTNEIVTLWIYGAHRMTEYTARLNYFVEDLKKMIGTATGIPPSRQSLYHHSSTRLIEMLEGQTLWECRINNNDHITMLTKVRQWEDFDSEDNASHTSAAVQHTCSKAQELQDLLDKMTHDDLIEEHERAKVQYKRARVDVSNSLTKLADFELSHPRIVRRV
jgi:hypothetical protein